MTNDKGARLVLFGRHAGYSGKINYKCRILSIQGMINGLHGLGLHLLGQGYNTHLLVWFQDKWPNTH
jgi:alpha-aminoadipic semialdehyde synthase